MLTLTLQFLIAMIASAINERTKRKLDYALEEVQVVKEAFRAATGKERIPHHGLWLGAEAGLAEYRIR